MQAHAVAHDAGADPSDCFLHFMNRDYYMQEEM